MYAKKLAASCTVEEILGVPPVISPRDEELYRTSCLASELFSFPARNTFPGIVLSSGATDEGLKLLCTELVVQGPPKCV